MLSKRYQGWLVALSILLPTLLLAKPKELSEQELLALSVKVEKADKLFKKGQYDKALPIYTEAYEATEEPLMLFDMAQCYRNLKQPEEAAKAYKKFIKKAPDDAQRPLAEQLLAEVEAE